MLRHTGSDTPLCLCPSQPIGSGQTISAPHMHAHCLELLANHLQPGNRVLDVGSGSGYLSVAMARLVCPPDSPQQGMVVGVEHFPELVESSVAAVREIDWARQLMEQGRLRILQVHMLQNCGLPVV